MKIHKYREIFNTEFNLGFRVPRKDRRDRCEEMRINATEAAMNKFKEHEKRKIATKVERYADRASADSSHAVVCIHLENVITLPRASVKCFFYSRQLAVYNLTGHCSLDRSGYCAIWKRQLRDEWAMTSRVAMMP